MVVEAMMPQQKPGRSRQDYSTPRDFLDAVERRFGKIDFDLAATEENNVVPAGRLTHFGYHKGEFIDSLAQDWTKRYSNLWLNPPYGHIEPWARKCAESESRVKEESFPAQYYDGWRILLLIPASVGSNWFVDYVFGKALVLFLSPRLSFDGVAPYPKDLLLCCYGMTPGFECWRWRQ